MTQAHPHFEPPPEPDVEDVELDAGHFFSEDFGTTVAEQRRHEPIGDRIGRELPDDVNEGSQVKAAGAVTIPVPEVDAPSHWNLLVTVRAGGAKAARALIGRIGALRPSPFPDDVVLAHVDDVFEALDMLQGAMVDDPLGRAAIVRVRPAQHTLACHDLAELERVTGDLVGDWRDELAGATFHVRCHHRGGGDDIDASEVEAFLGEAVLRELEVGGTPGSIDFDDPDAVIDVETLGGEAAISLWTRDDLRAYPFLRIR